MANHEKLGKWLVLSAVATALLVIPRRSSRKSDEMTDANIVNLKNKRSHHGDKDAQ